MAKLTAKVTAKGQVTIPKAIREKLALEEGDWLVFEPKENSVEVRKGRVMDDADFERFAAEVEKRFEARGMTRADVEDGIQWARKNKS